MPSAHYFGNVVSSSGATASNERSLDNTTKGSHAQARAPLKNHLATESAPYPIYLGGQLASFTRITCY
eukprot:5520263-Amphidinium_carterae.1